MATIEIKGAGGTINKIHDVAPLSYLFYILGSSSI
jgi:hypothetical protein